MYTVPVVNGLTGWRGAWKDLKSGNRSCREGHGLPNEKKTVRIFALGMNVREQCHYRRDNENDRIYQSIDVSQPSTLHIPRLKLGPMYRVTMVAEMEVGHRLNSKISLIKANVPIAGGWLTC
jgi:hypothetical protein